MSWLILFALGAITLVGLSFFARPGRGAIELVAAILLLGFAGYAWQGNPGLAGKPTKPRANHDKPDAIFAEERMLWLPRVGPEAQMLDTADSLIRNGDAPYAVGILRGAVGRTPDSMPLWLGLANALTVHADGMVTPPARYAFTHAAELAPKHPAPAYFMGLAYAKMGDLETAERAWRGILAMSPGDAPYRPLIEERLKLLARIRAAQLNAAP